jgi:hypothetical protein
MVTVLPTHISKRKLDVSSDCQRALPQPTTREGYAYVSDLVTRSNSKVLVAQFRIDSPRGEDERSRPLQTLVGVARND